MRHSFRGFVVTFLSVLLLLAAGSASAQERIVAVGDAHGDHDALVSILRSAGLIDEKLRWSGGRATLVITGDFFDRGPAVRKIMDLLMGLETQARRRRGNVIVLLGNHEAMNLTSNFPYVTPEAFASFADRNSQKKREAAYKQYVAHHQRLATRYGEGVLKVLDESEWMKAHPPGYFEYQQALSRQGKYGRWLRSKEAVARVGDTVFVHGGMTPEAAAEGLAKWNAQVRIELEGFERIRDYLVAQKLTLPFFDFYEIQNVVDQEAKRLDSASDDMRRVITAFRGIYQWTLYDAHGPLWFRGYAEWSDEEGMREVRPLLQALGAERIVVGHTIPEPPGAILPRFGARVFLIDTGMLRNLVDKGRPSALEIVGDRVSAIYESGRVLLAQGPAALGGGTSPDRVAAGRPFVFASQRVIEGVTEGGSKLVWRGPKESVLPFRTEEEVRGFLRSARRVKVEKKRLPGATKPQKLLVEYGGVRANAVFRSLHREEANTNWEDGTFTEYLRDSWKSEIAAYELALLLGIDRIPPTVSWQLDKVPGSLQIWIEKARPGFHPAEAEKPREAVQWDKQMESVRVFDSLIRNADRHEGNILVDSTDRVWWIDHTRAFGRERDIIHADTIRRCDRRLWDGLRRLDRASVTRTLSPFMGEAEIEALLERHAKLIELIQRRIDEEGETAVLFTFEEPAAASSSI